MTKIKLCAITTKSNTINAFMLESLIDMSNKGFDISIITDVQEGFLEKLPQNIKCYDLKMERKADMFGGFKTIKQMYKIFRKDKFDIIQYSTPNASFYASIASFFAGIPERLYLQWGIRYVGFYGFKRFFYKRIEKTTCLLATKIRPASKGNMNFAINEGLYKSSKAKVIGDGGTIGVSLKEYDRYLEPNSIKEVKKELGINDEFVFGFVGSIRNDKGVTELLNAFRKVIKTHSKTKLIIMGAEFDGDAIDEELKEWANNCEKVSFLGYVTNVPRYLSAIDLLVHPSYREGFSMVIQEAHALKKAVITTNIPGPSEVIEENKTGFLVPPKDTTELIAIMEYSILNPDIVSEMGELGRERVRRLFTRERMLKLTYEDRFGIYNEKSENR